MRAQANICLPGSQPSPSSPLCRWRDISSRLGESLSKGTANPLSHGLRRASSPEGGSFISAYRQMRKSSPFGGAGAVAPERVGVPLRADFPRPREDVA